MKRILLLAAGALGTAGMIAMAGPASADEATEGVLKPGQSQLEKFATARSSTRSCTAIAQQN
jgi:hypothetical protein